MEAPTRAATRASTVPAPAGADVETVDVGVGPVETEPAATELAASSADEAVPVLSKARMRPRRLRPPSKPLEAWRSTRSPCRGAASAPSLAAA
jgi:hypothetical protein